MNEIVGTNEAADWRRLKALVLDSVSSPITKTAYNLGRVFRAFIAEPGSWNRASGAVVRLFLCRSIRAFRPQDGLRSFEIRSGSAGQAGVWSPCRFGRRFGRLAGDLMASVNRQTLGNHVSSVLAGFEG
jgi:hypothetical protein